METNELKDRKLRIKRRILTMEWDMKQNQLHFAMKEKLKELKKELESVEQELGEIPAPHEEKSSEKVSVES